MWPTLKSSLFFDAFSLYYNQVNQVPKESRIKRAHTAADMEGTARTWRSHHHLRHLLQGPNVVLLLVSLQFRRVFHVLLREYTVGAITSRGRQQGGAE